MYYAAVLNSFGRACGITAFNNKHERDMYVEDYPTGCKAITRKEAIKIVGLDEVKQYQPCPEWEYTRD